MDCVNHPGVDAPYTCCRCRCPICVDCESKLEGRSICHNCVGQMRARLAAQYESETRQIGYMGACLSGALATLASVLAWSQIVVWTNGYRFEAGAALLGGAVGYAVMAGAGNKRSNGLQQLASVLTLVGVFIGYLCIFLRTDAASRLAGPGFASSLIAFPTYLTGLTWLDWVFLTVGVGWGYWIPHVRYLRE